MKITQITKIEKQLCYDLTVENTSCFFANGVLIHNSNGGVRVSSDNVVIAQGRNRELTVQQDNFGFAAFVHKNADLFRRLIRVAHEVTIYGEWIGSGIQKGVAVSNLPRQFVVFGLSLTNSDGELIYEPLFRREQITTEDQVAEFNNAGIYFIDQVPTYKITIDFNNLEESAAIITDLTYQVEENCPWGVFHGVHGVGEGIVWSPAVEYYDTRLWFKSKGVRHKTGGEKKKIDIDPVKVNTIKELVDAILPEWRLEQGVSELKQNGIDAIPENTGHYIKWIHKDILKEETDQIVNNDLTWKDVVGEVSNRAKTYFLNLNNI